MIRRVIPLLLVAVLALCGLVVADDNQATEPDKAKGDAPLRLKRKKRPDAPPPVDKEDVPKKGKDKGKGKGEERLQPEDGPPAQEEDDKEVLDRIARNMRAVEEKLGNREIGERTSQQQRDILEDIDRLLKKSQQQQKQNQDQQQGGEGQPPPQAGGGDQQKQRQQQMSRQQKSGAGKQGKQGKQRPRRLLPHERGQKSEPKQQQGKESKGLEKQGPEPEPKSGDKPGAGGNGKTSDRDPTADLKQGIWGHLPESLRAEMNAYSNPTPFLPRYDRVVIEYYKTIARQGQKKGKGD